MNYKSKNISGFITEKNSKLLIQGIQEWNDINNDGIMQDNEKIGQLYYIGDYGYEKINYDVYNYDDVYEFHIREKSNNFLQIVLYLQNNFTEYYNPNIIKFDIIISNWYYENNENQLSLLMEYKTDSDIKTNINGYSYQKYNDTYLDYSVLKWENVFVYDKENKGTIKPRLLNNNELSSLLYTDKKYSEEQSSGMLFCFSAKGSSDIYWYPNIGIYNSIKNDVLPKNINNDDTLLTIFIIIFGLLIMIYY